jgi:hypothetical protein
LRGVEQQDFRGAGAGFIEFRTEAGELRLAKFARAGQVDHRHVQLVRLARGARAHTCSIDEIGETGSRSGR